MDMDEEQLRVVLRVAVREALVLGNTEIIDHDARAIASQAMQMFQSHERLCAERTKNADLQRSRMEQSIEKIVSLQNKQMVAVIGVLVTALAFFLIPYFQLPRH